MLTIMNTAVLHFSVAVCISNDGAEM